MDNKAKAMPLLIQMAVMAPNKAAKMVETNKTNRSKATQRLMVVIRALALLTHRTATTVQPATGVTVRGTQSLNVESNLGKTKAVIRRTMGRHACDAVDLDI
jgi:hypothetical protein